VLVFNGIGQLNPIPLESVEYRLYGPEYSDILSSGSTVTFFNFFTTSCSTLGLTLDTTNATDYNITFTMSSDELLIDVMDKMAASLVHGFYIDTDSSTLYLLDLLKDDGTTLTFNEHDHLISTEYSGPTPIALFQNADETLAGAYSHGTNYTVRGGYQTNTTYMQAQLARAKTILDKHEIVVTIPIEDNTIKYGQKITWTDTTRINDLTVTMWAREMNYMLSDDEERLVIKGEGAIT
jgi:hypothetical protein